MQENDEIQSNKNEKGSSDKYETKEDEDIFLIFEGEEKFLTLALPILLFLIISVAIIHNKEKYFARYFKYDDRNLYKNKMKFDFHVLIGKDNFNSFDYNNSSKLVWSIEGLIYGPQNYSSNFISIPISNNEIFLKVNYLN